ncbi:putative methyltransferase PMT28 [Acorus calamus]|uniref:Methyltransferase n=1 Tax=Acorus calamus TaxID=4465 RepID=A0AAV9CJM8_ACOCL|nr:putative methyltransferase PMT28 [Acorus calamus]
MAVGKPVRHHKPRTFGFVAKVSAAVVLGLCFVVVWSAFSSPSTAVSEKRSSFGDINEPPAADPRKKAAVEKEKRRRRRGTRIPRRGVLVPLRRRKLRRRRAAGARIPRRRRPGRRRWRRTRHGSRRNLRRGRRKREMAEKEGPLEERIEEEKDGDLASDGGEDDNKTERKKKKVLGPLFDLKGNYNWRQCNVKTGHNYIPCVDLEASKFQRYRHHERSCPRTVPHCLVALPTGYQSPVPWPESEWKIWYGNVAHPKLSTFIKRRSWLTLTGDHLIFNESEGRAVHYLNSIEEMVPDIEWGKNIRIVLDIGCSDASFSASLLGKEVTTLSLGLMDDQVDLAQVALERGFPAVVGTLGNRRLPFPSGVFDAIHCGECNINWHSNGGKLLVEINRILRPGGYFVLATKHGEIERDEGVNSTHALIHARLENLVHSMSTLTASICWNILAHRTDEISEVGVKIYQKPASNDIYELRRKKYPPLCKENEDPDVAWYTPIRTCVYTLPSAIEQRGTDWPEEWPQRLNNFPEWLSDTRDNLIADSKHWKTIVNKSYLNGMGIDWSKVRNVMDMRAIYGGFAAALAPQKVWVMNVIPVHAPRTLPIIYERGLLGIYHDWCESFSTYPRSYDLLHVDHLFTRLKNRCNKPVGIVVEMDRLLRPGGWAIVREKQEILNPLEAILRSLHWEIRMTFSKDKEGIICAQKTTWRP